jgi:hypothetical protein
MDGAAVDFALTRFEAVDDGRLEVEGRWSGVRGVRFVRPALVVHGDGGAERTLLADLEHKPWPALDGETWVAAFPWSGGGPPDVARTELAVAPSIVVPLAGGGASQPEPEPEPEPERRPRRTARVPRPSDAELAALREERDRFAGAARRAAEDLEALRRERDEARAALDRAVAERERLAAMARETPAAPDREALRAELRQRDEALAARDEALAARDAALAARDAAAGERDALRDALRERGQVADGAGRRREQALAERDEARRELAGEREAARRAVAAAEEAADAERRRAAVRIAELERALADAEAERDRALGQPAGVAPPPVRAPREHATTSARADWAARTAAIIALLVLLVLAITFLKAIA